MDIWWATERRKCLVFFFAQTLYTYYAKFSLIWPKWLVPGWLGPLPNQGKLCGLSAGLNEPFLRLSYDETLVLTLKIKRITSKIDSISDSIHHESKILFLTVGIPRPCGSYDLRDMAFALVTNLSGFFHTNVVKGNKYYCSNHGCR